MREILFRGKTEAGKWVYGGYFETNNEIYIVEDTTNLIVFDIWNHAEFVIPETVGQFTGLYDINGKKVFEGDILIWKNEKVKERNDGSIEYGAFNCECCEGVYGWYLTNGDIRNLKKNDFSDVFLKVIGNKYDNPELLKN